jgi:phytoene dehydrogenase-like protein
MLVIGALAVLSLPTAPVLAQDRDDRRPAQEHRYYDSTHKDYHAWNGDEDRRYRAYLDESHRQYRDFSRLSKKQQREYWQWRHDHEDRR